MAIKNEKYSREFVSRTEYYESGNHEDSELIPYQTINKEDQELREEIMENYALKRKREGLEETGTGFDGEKHYKFSIFHNFPKELQGDTEKNGKYKTTIEIRKAGNKKILNTYSDLEQFLLCQQFEKHEE